MGSYRRVFTYLLMASSLLITGCTEEDDTVMGDWIRRSDFDGVARSDATSFSIDDKGYVFGGYDGKNRLSDLWEYNSVQDYWTQKAVFPGESRNTATSFALDGKGYVGTGYNGDSYLKDFWEYDPEGNLWTRKADFGGSARTGAVCFGIEHKGYMGTGYDGNFLKDFWRYDPLADTWEQIMSIGGSKRNNATSFVIGGKAYVVCGVNNGSYITDFWYYDPLTQVWDELRSIANETDDDFDDEYSITRANALAMVIGDKVYLTCGESGSLRADTWIYYPATDIWEASTSFEGTTRTGAVCISTGSRGFIVTGRSSTYRFDDMWEFLPEEEYDEGY